MTVDACAHLVQFYADGDPLGPNVCSFVAAPLLRGEAAVVVATSEHRAVFAAELSAAGLDVPALRREGRYIELDAAGTLSTFMTDDGPDEQRFRAVVGGVVSEAARRFGAVHAYGEMVGLLAAEGRLVAALELESLWSRLMVGEQSFRLLCGYPREAFGALDHPEVADVCSAHDAVAPTTGLTAAFDLPLGAEAAGALRRAVRAILVAWGFHDRDWCDDAELVVSELLGNAVRHAASRVAVSLDAHEDQVTVSVTDGSAEVPQPRALSHFAENGRGVAIIDALSDGWGVERQPRGKRVWARLRPPGASAGDAAASVESLLGSFPE